MPKDQSWRNKPRILWSVDERDAVYSHCVSLLADDAKATKADVFAMAMELAEIPPHRRRPFSSPVLAEINERLQCAASGKPPPKRGPKVTLKHAKSEDVPPAPIPSLESPAAPPMREPLPLFAPDEPIPIVERANGSAASASSLQASPPSDVSETPTEDVSETPTTIDDDEQKFARIGRAVTVLADHFGDALVDAIAKALTSPRVARTLSEILNPSTSAESPAAVDPEPPEPHSELTFDEPKRKRERERLPRVLVAGLLPSQIHEIGKAFQGRADLRYWKSSDAVSLLRKQVQGCDAAVGMVLKMNHSPDAVLQSRAPTYFRAKGGVTTVKREIERALKVIQLERGGHVVQH
jgi:hypothetical protein